MAGVYLFMGGTETISNTTYSSGFTLLNSNSVDHLAPISSLCSFIVLLFITLSLSLFVFIVVLFIAFICCYELNCFQFFSVGMNNNKHILIWEHILFLLRDFHCPFALQGISDRSTGGNNHSSQAILTNILFLNFLCHLTT